MLKTTCSTDKITDCFFQNWNAHTSPLFKNLKILEFSDKVALENCILISKSLLKILPKTHCDWFILSLESNTHSVIWAHNGCIGVPSHFNKYYGNIYIILLL